MEIQGTWGKILRMSMRGCCSSVCVCVKNIKNAEELKKIINKNKKEMKKSKKEMKKSKKSLSQQKINRKKEINYTWDLRACK